MNDRSSQKKNVFSQQIRERVSVSHESVFQNAFFSQPKIRLTVPRCCFSLFGVFYSIDLGCSLVFPIMQPERRFFRVTSAPRARFGGKTRGRGRTRVEGGDFYCVSCSLCVLPKTGHLSRRALSRAKRPSHSRQSSEPCPFRKDFVYERVGVDASEVFTRSSSAAGGEGGARGNRSRRRRPWRSRRQPGGR